MNSMNTALTLMPILVSREQEWAERQGQGLETCPDGHQREGGFGRSNFETRRQLGREKRNEKEVISIKNDDGQHSSQTDVSAKKQQRL